MKKDNIGDRMKGYENVSRIYLTKRMPTIIRVDGKAFHTFTRGFDKPFDEIMGECMCEAAKFLCENIQGCKIAYTQSDEISLLLTDYDKLNTCSWFDKNIQKMVSVSASMATLAFNKAFSDILTQMKSRNEFKLIEKYSKREFKAMFDSRVFNIPKEEVCNYFIWRQQDATRNSIESVGQANFSAKDLHKVNCNQIQEKLFTEKGINWNDFPIFQKRGFCIVKKQYNVYSSNSENVIVRSRWDMDDNIPVFTQDRNYIEQYL